MERLCDFSTANEPIELPPGFRFHPTDEELITHYLSPKALDNNFTTDVVGEVNLNKVEPWDLPRKAKMGEKEMYFFCMRDRKYPMGSRTNRATEARYWKATGKDKEIYRAKVSVGMKKTLVFYRGRAPRGQKSDWVMHEYRLRPNKFMHNNFKSAKNDWVICRIFNKHSLGKKLHINHSSKLPPLMDISRDEKNQSRTAEESQVTCFSDLIEDRPNRPVDRFHSSEPPFIFSQFPNQDIRVNADIWTAIYDHEIGIKPYMYDQDFPIISTDRVDFDCLWDY